MVLTLNYTFIGSTIQQSSNDWKLFAQTVMQADLTLCRESHCQFPPNWRNYSVTNIGQIAIHPLILETWKCSSGGCVINKLTMIREIMAVIRMDTLQWFSMQSLPVSPVSDSCLVPVTRTKNFVIINNCMLLAVDCIVLVRSIEVTKALNFFPIHMPKNVTNFMTLTCEIGLILQFSCFSVQLNPMKSFQYCQENKLCWVVSDPCLSSHHSDMATMRIFMTYSLYFLYLCQ